MFLGLLFLSVTPLFLRARVYLNVQKNIGALSVKLLGIFTIQKFRFKLTRMGVVMLSSDSEGEDTEDDMTFLNKLAIEMLKLVKINELSVFSSLGVKGDALATALVGGSFLAFVNAMLAVLITQKGEFKSFVSISSNFQESVFTIGIHLSVFTNLMSILAATILAKQKTTEVMKKHERKHV